MPGWKDILALHLNLFRPLKRGIVKLFRHTRLTELSRRGISEPTLRAFAGWTDGSLMSKVYVHLSGRDMTNEILVKIHGVPAEKVKLPEPLLQSRECKRCHNMNSSTAVRCSECDMLLVQDEIELLVDEKIKAIMNEGGFVKTKDDEMIYIHKHKEKEE